MNTYPCHCSSPMPIIETFGFVRIVGGEVLDTEYQVCTCRSCGGDITPDVILAELPAEAVAELSEIQF